jgi:hypothetical protein
MGGGRSSKAKIKRKKKEDHGTVLPMVVHGSQNRGDR